MLEHTPTPYAHAGDIGTIIATIDGNRIAIAVVACTGHDIDTTDSAIILPMEENRDFLIHAANCHNDLLQECKVALEQLEEICLSWPVDGSSSGYNALGEKIAGIDAAIAKAEGE